MFEGTRLENGQGRKSLAGGIAVASADIARILFYIFVVIFLVLVILGLMGKQGWVVARTLGVCVQPAKTWRNFLRNIATATYSG